MNWTKYLKDKNFKTAFLIVLGALIIGVALGELTLRLILPAEERIDDSLVVRNDPILGITLVPNSPFSGTDSNGFKNKDLQESYKVVALGDSHTIGGFDKGEDISWPRFLGDFLGERVYNMGVHGYGLAQYFYLLDKALTFKPKLILVGIYMGNDIFDSYNVVYHYQGWDKFRSLDFIDNQPAPTGYLKEVKTPLKGLRDFLRKKSVFYKFLGQRTRIFREKIGLSKPLTIGTRNWSINDENVSLLYDKRSEIKTLFWVGSRVKGVNKNDTKIQEGLRLTKVFISEIKRKIKKDNPNTKLAMVLIPSKESVYAKIISEDGYKNEIFSKIIEDEDYLKKDLLKHCERENIVCIDILFPLEEALRNGVKIYKETWDEHPTKEGYMEYAKAIFTFVKPLLK